MLSGSGIEPNSEASGFLNDWVRVASNTHDRTLRLPLDLRLLWIGDRFAFLLDSPIEVLEALTRHVVAAEPIVNGSKRSDLVELLQVGGGNPFAHVGAIDVIKPTYQRPS